VIKQTARRGRGGKDGGKNNVGRPLVTLADLRQDWRQVMMNIYRGGGCDAEVQVELALEGSSAISNDLWQALQAQA
jgi:hypothetical protein